MPDAPSRSAVPGRALVTRRALVEIVRVAVLGSYGVTGLADSLLRRAGLRRAPIRVSLAPQVAVDVRLTIAYGLPVAEVAARSTPRSATPSVAPGPGDRAVRSTWRASPAPSGAAGRGRPQASPVRGRQRRSAQTRARRRVTRLACDGTGLMEAVRAAVANLEVHVDEINALNVFPVPDGDTGSNMLATCREMLGAVRDDASVASVADRMREGAHFGARGNTGVIHSQIVRGLAGVRRQAPLQWPGPGQRAGPGLHGCLRRGPPARGGHDAHGHPRGLRRRGRDRRAFERPRGGPGGGHPCGGAGPRQDAQPPAGAARGGVVDSAVPAPRLFEGSLPSCGRGPIPAPVRAPTIPIPMPAEFVHLETGHATRPSTSCIRSPASS